MSQAIDGTRLRVRLRCCWPHAKLREQLGEVVVVPILNNSPAPIEFSHGGPPNAERAAGRRNALDLAIVRPADDPLIGVIASSGEQRHFFEPEVA